jgi:hypothetical protein
LKEWITLNGYVLTSKFEKNITSAPDDRKITSGKYSGALFQDMDDGYMQYIKKNYKDTEKNSDEYKAIYAYACAKFP